MYFFLSRTFDMKGRHLSEEAFSVALPSVLSLHFMEQPEDDCQGSYLSVHWSGDVDMEDTRIWVQACVKNGHRGGMRALSR